VTQTVIAYTDGACSGNPGAGAWAFRIEWPDGSYEEAAGAASMTTNNREELKAVREALRAIRARIGDDAEWRIVVRTDSLGVINWLTGQWKRKANLDLFPTIDPLIDRRVGFEHVRGHSGEPGNERVDALAVAAVARQLAGGASPPQPQGELPL
jgi:ribonuclease HI